MRGWQAILIAAAVLIGAAIALALAMPRHFRVERSIQIDAPAEAVWAQIGDLEAHEAWSPWIANDPTLVITYGHTTTGSGAYYDWSSADSQPGRFTITASDPPSRIDYEVTFPGLGSPTGFLEATPSAGGTLLTVRFDGTSEGPLGGVVALWMDRLVGSSFEGGLAQIKTLAEAAPAPAPVSAAAPKIAGAEGTDPGGALPPIP